MNIKARRINIRCFLGFHKPKPEAVYGYMASNARQALLVKLGNHWFPTVARERCGQPDYDKEFAYIAQKCERCGKILSVCWPPKDQVIREITW